MLHLKYEETDYTSSPLCRQFWSGVVQGEHWFMAPFGLEQEVFLGRE